ncbi:hypothetical protein K8P10_002753 [Leucobacter sp. Psy1]|uniref:hypothetical protein n=1 Tax=Leucobacter sp. Psy1 TaxID=2875729 RepID=UPI001CD554AD|nr:hypothetical protein [Leucobacter sp. Psy1]UBH07242.1 hypothetical protein K8P10_002753 [Leucobacter sp. Psy1]
MSEQPLPKTEAASNGRAAGHRTGRRWGAVAAATTAIILVGAYSGAVGLAPLPELQPTLAVPAEQEISADETAVSAVADGQEAPSGVGFVDSALSWASDDETHEIASLTKLVTALVGLEEQPIAAGETGPTYTVTEADDEIRDRVLQDNGVVEDAPAGLELTARQMLELILMPSANNYAISYAEWVFGSEAAFVEAAAAWAEREGLESLRIVDPTGLSEQNLASAADLVQLGRLALEHPVVAEIVAQSWVGVPGVGPIENSNPILGDEGVVGVKTGTTTTAGFNLVAAREATVDGRPVTAVSVALGRADDDARAADSRTMLDEALSTVQQAELLTSGTIVGSVVVWDGTAVPLVSAAGATAVLIPGETATLTTELGALSADPAGSVVGGITVATPTGKEQVRVVTDDAVEEPDFWWRFTHPAIVFGWTSPAA